MSTPRHTRHLLLAALLGAAGCSAPETYALRPARQQTPEDAGVSDVAPTVDVSAPVDVAPPPPPPPPPSPCVTGRRWRSDDEDDGDRRMNPGQACITCHRRNDEEDAPRQLAGTVYVADHQENNCYGFAGNRSTGSGGAYVEVVDGAGTRLQLPINESGNFFYEDERRPALRFPLRSAAVVGPTGQRNEMGSGPPHGDCNACHTQAGATTVSGGDPAPGRILVVQ